MLMRHFSDPGAAKYPRWHVPLYMFGWAFGVVNPLIYALCNQTYREAYKSTLRKAADRISRCCCCCCNESEDEPVLDVYL